MARLKGHYGIVVFCMIVGALGLGLGAPGLEFAGGTGEPTDPYQIATTEQLIALDSAGEGVSGKCFRLVADIDLAGVEWAHPIITSFAGTLDGNGHVVRNLRATGVEAQGLFGTLQNGARVSNLGVVDADVVSTAYAGTLAAQNWGTVLNCYSTGFVAGMEGDTGGLVGLNRGTVTGSRSAVEVIGDSPVGGLVGNNMGFVSECASTGAVLGNGRVGGLVGYNTGYTSASCSNATVTGSSEVGGLVGRSSAGVTVCYSTGSVTGTSQVGGLIGYNSGRVSSCYCTTEPSGPTTSSGYLVGMNSSASGTNVTGCYFLGQANPRAPASTSAGTGLTADQMKQRASYAGWDFWGTAEDGTVDAWFMPPDACPVLAWQTETTGLVVIPDVAGLALDEAADTLAAGGLAAGIVIADYDRATPGGSIIYTYPRSFALPGDTIDLALSLGNTYDWAWNPGNGTAADPYQIQTPGELESVADHPELWTRSFVLTADLDMIGRTYSAALIAPDTSSTTGFQGTPFTGSLNGNKHVIRNLRMVYDSPSSPACFGLFGKIDKPGQVNGLALKDVAILAGTGTGATHVGALTAYNSGTVIDCSATGVISAGCSGSFNGLVGSGQTSAVNSTADVVIIRPYCGSSSGSPATRS